MAGSSARCSSGQRQGARKPLGHPEPRLFGPTRQFHRAAQDYTLLADELLTVPRADRLLAIEAGLEMKPCPLGRESATIA